MIPRASITAWRREAPWAEDWQVEQDLVLSRVLGDLFNRPKFADQAAFRGGTAEFENSWFSGRANLVTYTLPELLGTKLRALYPRKNRSKPACGASSTRWQPKESRPRETIP